MSLSDEVRKFADNCKLDKDDPKAILNRFLTLQVNATSWEHTYGHSTRGDSGKSLSQFKYEAVKGAVEAYARTENCHKFGASLWRDLFKGAKISDKLSGDKDVAQKLAVFFDFGAKVLDPIDSNMPMDKKLMLFFLLNTKQKNLRNLIYDSDLGLGLNRGQQNTLYTRMSEYEMREDTKMNLAKEIGTLISQLELPCATKHSKLHVDLQMVPKKASQSVSEKVESSRGSGDQKAIFNIKTHRAEGWTDAKELALGENPVIQQCKQKMKLRFAPNKDLARQLVFSAITPDHKHWSTHEQLTNGRLALATQVKESLSDIDPQNWSNLIKVVGYGETKYAAKSDSCVDFFQHLADAIPASKRNNWTSKDLVQMFVTAHLPNWQQHWKENWDFDPKIERAVKRYIHEHPVPSEEFVNALSQGF